MLAADEMYAALTQATRNLSSLEWQVRRISEADTREERERLFEEWRAWKREASENLASVARNLDRYGIKSCGSAVARASEKRRIARGIVLELCKRYKIEAEVYDEDDED